MPTTSKTFVFFGEAMLNLTLIVISAIVLLNIFRYGRHFIAARKKPFPFAFPDRLMLVIVYAFSFLGFAIGLLTGLSLSPVVQAVIPGLLTFYGGFITYIFSKDTDEKKQLTILLAAMALSFFLIYGAEVGTLERNDAASTQRRIDLEDLNAQDSIHHKYR